MGSRPLRARNCKHFDAAILLQNAFDAALIAWLAGIPERIGYNRDARGLLLTQAIPVPEPGEIPRHQRFYYLELLRRAAMIERYPDSGPIRLEGIDEARVVDEILVSFVRAGADIIITYFAKDYARRRRTDSRGR